MPTVRNRKLLSAKPLGTLVYEQALTGTDSFTVEVLAWRLSYHLLRALFHSSGIAQGQSRWFHAENQAVGVYWEFDKRLVPVRRGRR